MSRCVIRNTHVGTSTANEESKSVIGQFRAVPVRPAATLQNAARLVPKSALTLAAAEMSYNTEAVVYTQSVNAVSETTQQILF